MFIYIGSSVYNDERIDKNIKPHYLVIGFTYTKQQQPGDTEKTVNLI